MKIEKVLNNNAAVILDNGREAVVMGCGIAFKKKAGDKINPSEVNKVFVLNENEMNSRFQKLIQDIPLEHILLSEKIISMVKSALNNQMSDSIYITLSDHISTAIDRYYQGITLHNPMFWDIKQFYPKEFMLGEKALEIICEEYSIHLSEDEAAFIALHIVNAQISEDMGAINRVMRLIHEITSIVKYHFKLNLSLDSLAYFRFINHLKLFAKRLFSEKDYKEEDANYLQAIKEQQVDAYKCSMAVSNFIHKKYGCRISNVETLYMTVHIARIVREEGSI